MRKNRAESDSCRHSGTLPQLCLYRVFAPQRRGCQNFIHAALAFHRKQTAEAQRTQQPRQKGILHIGGAGKAKQFFIAGFIDKPRAGILLEIILYVGLNNLLIHRVFLLQRVVRQQGVAAQLAANYAPLHLQHGDKFLALFGQPVVAFGAPRSRNVLHIIGVVNFVRVYVAFRRYALIDAKRQKRRQKHRSTVHQQQLSALLTGDGGGARCMRQRKGKAALGGRQQLCLGKYRAEYCKQAAAQNGCRQPLDQRQADGAAEPEQVPIISQQFVGLQQAYHIGVFYDIPMARGGNRRPNPVHRQGQRQCADPSGGSAFGDKGSQHDPQPHHKRAGPFGKQKPKQILPDGDLHGAAHQGGNTLNGAIQRA